MSPVPRDGRRVARASTVGLALLLAASAQAEWNAAAVIATDYLHRGINQTLSGPAIQASAEYSSSAGWFAGLWASRVDFESFDDRRAELDYYVGYGRRVHRRLAFETTFIRYDYRGDAARDYDWQELQLTAFIGDHLSATWAHAENWAAADERTNLLEGTLRYPLPAGLILDLTAGRHFVSDALGRDYDYGQLGVSRPISQFVVRAAYADSDLTDLPRQMIRGRWLLSLTWQR